ncbi:Disulphide bond corrector protein DsbC [Pedobacter sp. ok626]|uniref:protein-disulfide reductase DsbD domain-containing protein n=1 Tax=Pedobacter sp. ok626 TaxID=1761882 RepID=UPI00088FC29D|nr:protein-disulfide reductase DsbD domain-containing protein [Pedobacter sp. ok626]SDK65331.1 Disulphide bond corrector protein DsbC [Pedobacter sp. ok626]
MKRIILLIILVQTTVASFAQNNHPVSWKLSSELIAPLTYQIKLHAVVKAPYHIYPQGAAGGMGMPTEFLFVQDDNVEFVGEMTEKGEEQKEGESLAYYAKGVTFTQTLKLKSERKTTVAFTVKYMACTNQMCLPPIAKDFTLDLADKTKTINEIDTIKPNNSPKPTDMQKTLP